MLKIGAIQLDVPFVQAALAGYSDVAMRRVNRRHGAPYALAEVVLDKFVIKGGKAAERFLNVPQDDHPVGAQLMGANPGDFAPAAVAMVEGGFDVIDINFGCPVKKVLGRRRGGFLLSQPETALEIVQRVYDAVGRTHPVTVKMRRGIDDTPEAKRNFFLILDGVFQIGVSAVTVHPRSVEQRYAGPSDWSFLTSVKRHVGDRVILGSGDLFSAPACVRMIRETGVDGVTVARGCIGNPWIFQECRALWSGNPLPPPPTIRRQREAIVAQFADMVELHGQQRAAKILRKFGIKYSAHHPLRREVREAFITAKNADDVNRILDVWYDDQKDWPPVRRRETHGDLVAAGATP